MITIIPVTYRYSSFYPSSLQSDNHSSTNPLSFFLIRLMVWDSFQFSHFHYRSFSCLDYHLIRSFCSLYFSFILPFLVFVRFGSFRCFCFRLIQALEGLAVAKLGCLVVGFEVDRQDNLVVRMENLSFHSFQCQCLVSQHLQEFAAIVLAVWNCFVLCLGFDNFA